jgi:hypothetical protein
MGKWDEKGNLSVTFDVKPDEKMQAFVERMLKEHEEREEAFMKRIKQLFDEKIKLGGPKKEEVYRQVLNVFSLGYQCGWADLKSLYDKYKEN